MKVDRTTKCIKDLVRVLNEGTLCRSEEYQRGAVWKPVQQQTLIDSVFRGYPIPPLFLHKITKYDLDNRPSSVYEIIDGQQRLNALSAFLGGKIRLLEVKNPTLRIPESLRQIDVPWSGKGIDDLAPDLRTWFEKYELGVLEIVPESKEPEKNQDEVRDLFIRLQSGTALSPQQVRDAWPGTIGPFITKLAGRFHNAGKFAIFGMLDRRGQRDGAEEDGQDLYANNRQMCAQLRCWFMGRESDYRAAPKLSPDAVNGLYQEFASLPADSPQLERFEKLLGHTQNVFDKYNVNNAGNGQSAGRRRRVISKRDLFVIFSFLQDISRNPQIKLNMDLCIDLAKNIPADGIPSGHDAEKRYRQDVPNQLLRSYEAWRDELDDSILKRLDNLRAFTGDQKRIIYERDNAMCAICKHSVEVGEDEYDHFPIPFRAGGATEVSNGRLVHRKCHPRGRPSGS